MILTYAYFYGFGRHHFVLVFFSLLMIILEVLMKSSKSNEIIFYDAKVVWYFNIYVLIRIH